MSREARPTGAENAIQGSGAFTMTTTGDRPSGTMLIGWLCAPLLLALVLLAAFGAEQAKAERGLMPGSVIAKYHAPINHTPPSFWFGYQGGFIFGQEVQWMLDIENAPEVEDAGSHPDFTTSFRVNTDTGQPMPLGFPVGRLRDLTVDTPAGFVGNPRAVPRCQAADFHATMFGQCPPASQIGFAMVVAGGVNFAVPVYSMEPAPGEPARLGFKSSAIVAILVPEVRSDGDYGLRVGSLNTPAQTNFFGATVTLWGVPHDPVHDYLRINAAGNLGGTVPTSPEVFLTTPTNCNSGDLETTFSARWWQDADTWATETVSSPEPTNCEDLPFGGPGAEVSLTTQPTSRVADSPTGLDVNLEVPYQGDPNLPSNPHLKAVEVALPEGMSVNPAAANGMEACSEAEIGLDSLSQPSCPNASKLGTVEVKTPLLDDPMKGSVYQAQQGSNPFNSTFAIYIHAKGPGVQIKLAGKIEPDDETGQLTASFTDNPQLPFTNFNLRFFGGPQAALVNPDTCGTKTTTATLTPWSAPHSGPPVQTTDSFQITEAPNGQPCSATKQQRPFGPQMNAGLKNAVSSSYSPFLLNLTRPDGHQELSSLKMTMPEGVTAKLAGVAYCPDQVLAGISDEEGTGQAEHQSPACPANSQVGTATVGAGAGQSPVYVSTGKAYLAGPYGGAPLSLAVVVPALTGPFDLGTTVVRSKLEVDPRTAQVTVESDPLPQILHGVPLRIRDIRINVDRAEFMKAPTDCSAKQITAQIQGSHGKSAALTNRFQVGECASLGFSPKLKLSFGTKKADTKPNAHPRLNAKLAFNEGDANISRVEVALPQGLLLDQERLGRICSRANYAANTCPEESRVGYAKATTPLLDEPVEGPVYLKASDNPLPDLAADLNGQIDIDLFGKIDQKLNKKGLNQIRNTFDVVPDVPVSSFQLTLDGGNDGLLVNSRNICNSKSAQKLSIEMTAHNEMSLSEKPLIGSACKQINAKKAKKLNKQAKKLLAKAKSTSNKQKAKALRKQARKLKRQAKQLGR